MRYARLVVGALLPCALLACSGGTGPSGPIDVTGTWSGNHGTILQALSITSGAFTKQ